MFGVVKGLGAWFLDFGLRAFRDFGSGSDLLISSGSYMGKMLLSGLALQQFHFSCSSRITRDGCADKKSRFIQSALRFA